MLPNDCSIQPAKHGDAIALFGTGFGKTEPEVPVGRIATVVGYSAGRSKCDVWSTTGAGVFSGLAFGLAGVFQIVVEVPEVPDGDYEVLAEITGRTTQSDAFITVQREP